MATDALKAAGGQNADLVHVLFLDEYGVHDGLPSSIEEIIL